MRKHFLAVLAIVFAIGWISNSFYSPVLAQKTANYEGQASIGGKDISGNSSGQQPPDEPISSFESLQKMFSDGQEAADREKPSPYDHIDMGHIFVYGNEVIIKIDNPEWSMFTDTNSMDPVIDTGSNAIEVIPKTESEVHIGDIVAYKSKYSDGIVTHRVISEGHDEEGWYATLKGDNNDEADPGKVRFEQIKRIVVAIIY